jgi:hypothetical protein
MMTAVKLPKHMTYGEKYGFAMHIDTQEAADEYFEALVEHGMQFNDNREEVEAAERQSLGYYSGYYDNETMIRVQKLFRCIHPVFGKIEKKEDLPTQEEAVKMGWKRAMKRKAEEESDAPD